MPRDLYKSPRWLVQAFGTDGTTSIAALDDRDLQHSVWVVPGGLLSDAFRSRFDALLYDTSIDGYLPDGCADAFLSGFTLAASSFQLQFEVRS